MIAVDVGNARIKLGMFAEQVPPRVPLAPPVLPSDDVLPEPEWTLAISGRTPDFGQLAARLGELPSAAMDWYIGSVNRTSTTRLIDWLRGARPQDRITLLAAGDLPLVVKLPRPDMVGVDRLLDALAANHLRPAGRPAIVVDVGTAITVDMVSAEGFFMGGAILPGIAMCARALHEFTDLLPQLDLSDLAVAPPVLGDCTESAMRSGLFWGAVGAVRQLVEQLANGDTVDVFLTGGAGPVVAELLGNSARHVPNLTLAGIALAAKW